MAYLESKGFVHRDLAARNIVMTDINQIKIINFNLRRIVDKDCYFCVKNYDTPMPVRLVKTFNKALRFYKVIFKISKKGKNF